MERRKTNKIMFLSIIILFLLLLFFMILLLRITAKQEDGIGNVTIIQDVPRKPEDVIDKYEAKYIKKDENTLYVRLPKDLYNEDGSSNEKFIKDFVKDLEPFYDEKNFEIIDENKGIVIKARYDEEHDIYDIIINDTEDFYQKTDGEIYVAVDNSQIVKGSNFSVTDYVLNKLEVHDGYFSHIEGELGEGEELENGYVSYQNGNVKVRTVKTGSARNIVYSKDYETQYTRNIDNTMTLKEILEVEPNPDFGSLKEGYLGYRQLNFYLFFYEDEVSVYSYSYRKNDKFEWMLEEYLKDRDLDKFVSRIKEKWKVYDKIEYDPETKNLYMLISTRGVEIDIKENNPKGIKLFSNYYFTDYTRQLVKNGQISFEPNTDLVNEVEKDRRNSN